MSLQVEDLGLIAYEKAFDQQKDKVRRVAAGADDALLLCEHPKTVTLGRKYKPENLFLSPRELSDQGVALIEVDRGGDVTLHSAGQLVLYAVIDLKRKGLGLKPYLQKLEQVAVDLLADFAIVAKGNDGNRGVWIDERKIASIGVGVSHWVTYHGMGLNVNTDLSLFNMMRPCGLDVKMTSLAKELDRPVDMDDIKSRTVGHFKRVFGYT